LEQNTEADFYFLNLEFTSLKRTEKETSRNTRTTTDFRHGLEKAEKKTLNLKISAEED